VQTAQQKISLKALLKKNSFEAAILLDIPVAAVLCDNAR
jgi:hypothetical protein